MFSQVLTPSQMQRIHDGSLHILDHVGVVVPHEKMLQQLQDSGAKVDHARQLVKMPAQLIDWALQTCGKQFTLYGRDLAQTAPFGFGRRNYNSIGSEASWLEEIGGPRRYARLADVSTAGRFADALPHITIAGAMADPHDLPVPLRCVEICAALLRNTTKPLIFFLHQRPSAKFIIDMLIALRGDEARAQRYPLFYPFFEPISALRFPHDGLDVLYETARLKMPVAIGPMAQMGASAPATLAGTLAQENAEILAGIVLTQLVCPGTAVVYGGICHAFDMRTTQMIFAGPEQALFGVALTQMGKRYGLPVYVNVGLTDSKRPDAQAGLEAGITLALAAAAGADIFGHMGICGVDQAASLDMLVLQHEVISYVESLMRTLDCSDEALGLDVIDQLGPGGSFIDTDHTVQHFRKELWLPKLLDRQYYDAWIAAGATATETRCRQEKQRILSEHHPRPISPDLDHELTRITLQAHRTLLP